MKKKVFNLLSCIMTLALIGLGIRGLNHLVRPTDTDGAYEQIETFHSLPENSLEVIVYGSSHALRGLNPMIMYQNYGIGAYNYSWHWQKINTTEVFLRDSLLTQKPKLAVIETYFAGAVVEDEDMSAEVYYTRYIRADKKDYLKQCFGEDIERYLSYYMPLCAFHDNWNTLTKQSFKPLKVGSTYRQNMGFTPDDKVTEFAKLLDPADFSQKEFHENSIEALERIVRTCRDHDIDVLFYTAPYEGAYNNHGAMSRFAEEHDCAYIDLFYHMDDMGLDLATDFSDRGHLNTKGANKVADYLGAYIHEHYELTDMRNVPENLWQSAGE